MESKALKDITVLDLTRVLAGPYCTLTLAEFGAEVIKIEVPDKGDDTRRMGPFKNGESMYYANVNHDKKGVTLNLKAPEGKKIFLELVRSADVVVENYRPGVMDKLGLGYDVLKEVNERLIYAAVSGFGSYGPCSQRPGYDIIAQSAGGLMSITGTAEGFSRAGNAMGDILGGMNLTIGILVALHARTLTGKGQRVDVSLVDSVVSSLETTTQRYFATGVDPVPMGIRYAAAYPYDGFHAKDGMFVIGCGNDKLFSLLCNAIGRQDLLGDSRFVTNDDRCTNHEALFKEIDAWCINHTVDEAVELINRAGVPVSPINTISRLVQDEHIAKAREMFVPLEHPVIGKMLVNGVPVKLMDTKATINTPAPALGQDNKEIFARFLDYGEEEINRLKSDGVL